MNREAYDILCEGAFAAHAGRARPAWLFSNDGTRLLFANAAGAAMLGLATAERAVGAAVPAAFATQIARSAATLRAGGPPRLERLRGLGAFGRPLTCTFELIARAFGPAVLVASTEMARPALTLADRARYLIEGGGAAAAFGADGTLLYATAQAEPHISRAASLRDLGDEIETLEVGDGTDTMVLAFFPAYSRPITSQPVNAVAAAQPALLDLSPIAEAITAMTKVPPQQNGKSAHRAIPHSRTTAPTPIAATRGPTAGIRCGSSGKPTPRTASPSAAANSLRSPDRARQTCSAASGRNIAKLALDPEGLVANALVSRGAWSGIEVNWPTAGDEDVRVTLSGIPAFDRDQTFRGYRGLGVWHGDAGDETEAMQQAETDAALCPDAMQDDDDAVAPIAVQTPDAASQPEEDRPLEPSKPAVPRDDAPSVHDIPLPAENVVPFRIAAATEVKTAALNPAERSAFRDLGCRLSARLKGADELARGLMEESDPANEPPYFPPVPAAAPQVQAGSRKSCSTSPRRKRRTSSGHNARSSTRCHSAFSGLSQIELPLRQPGLSQTSRARTAARLRGRRRA